MQLYKRSAQKSKPYINFKPRRQRRRGPVATLRGRRHVAMLPPSSGKQRRTGHFVAYVRIHRTGKPGKMTCGAAEKALDAPLCALKLHGHRFMTDRSAPRRGGLRSAGCIGRGGGRGHAPRARGAAPP